MTLKDENLSNPSSRREKLCRVVAVSFGLLCVLQAVLNISLRLALYSSDNILDIEASCNNLTEERDELKRKLTDHDRKTRDIETKLKILTEERDELKIKLTDFAEYCRQGWVYFNNSFYYISSRKESWQDSRSDCQQRGADLVIINSKEEQEFTRRFRRLIWIGLTDRDKEGTWKWVDETPLTTSYWGTNEPNSHKGSDEDCGEIKFFDNENSWNDKPCETQNIWICEKTVDL